MNKTLQISFSLKNTYRVNSILYSVKQIPLIKKVLPSTLYSIWGFKIFANIIAAIWEILSIFLGKLIYLAFMIVGVSAMYEGVPQDALFLHIFLFLTVIGSYMNTYLFNPTQDKYYSIILLRMNARELSLWDYGYSMVKLLVGFLPFVIYFGCQQGVPLWISLLCPFSIASLKMLLARFTLRDFEKTGEASGENQLGKFVWIVTGLLLAAAYLPPAFGLVLPLPVVTVLLVGILPFGLWSLHKIITFAYYEEMDRQLLKNWKNPVQVGDIQRQQSERLISSDTTITSQKKGFEYLNDLFIRRHQKILWKSSKRLSAICAVLILACLLMFYLLPQTKKEVNELLLVFLPYFVFIMYAINRGTGFTRALFMNCDHSLLTYSFYKQPSMILKLFRIRLREIIKINLLPGVILGIGLALLLYASGGTDNPMNYGILATSIICMSIFFSVHYLTIYYLLQPYNAGTEIKSATYQIVMSATYLVCFCMMQVRMPILTFGILCIVFCFLYFTVACVLIYRFAPKTFRLRN